MLLRPLVILTRARNNPKEPSQELAFFTLLSKPLTHCALRAQRAPRARIFLYASEACLASNRIHICTFLICIWYYIFYSVCVYV